MVKKCQKMQTKFVKAFLLFPAMKWSLPNTFSRPSLIFNEIFNFYNWTLFLALNFLLQLNEYETAPYFIQLSQNLTSNCLLISLFLPVFACDYKIVLQIKSKQFYEHITQKLVKTEIHFIAVYNCFCQNLGDPPCPPCSNDFSGVMELEIGTAHIFPTHNGKKYF